MWVAPTPDAFSEQDVRLLGQTSAQIAIAVENARAYQRIARANAHLTDEKQYLEQELYREFADIVGSSTTLRPGAASRQDGRADRQHGVAPW